MIASDTAQTPRIIRGPHGKFISAHCPECGNGTLQREGDHLICDGLADPDHPNKELIACPYTVEL